MLGNDPGGDDLLDSAFLQARPGIAPESPAIVSEHAKLPAHLEQHGEAAFQVRHRELAGPWRELATMRIGTADLGIGTGGKPLPVKGIFPGCAPKPDRLFAGD